MKRCRDCGCEHNHEPASRMRSRVCKRCWETRLLVIRALKNGELDQREFQEYQRPGNRTERLRRMGLGHLVWAGAPADGAGTEEA